MSRKSNILLEKQANKIIENHFKSLSDVLSIKEIKDSQGKHDLTPTEQMENSINQFIKKRYDSITFNKRTGEVNKCIKIPTIELFEKGIMTGFYSVETEWLNVV